MEGKGVGDAATPAAAGKKEKPKTPWSTIMNVDWDAVDTTVNPHIL